MFWFMNPGLHSVQIIETTLLKSSGPSQSRGASSRIETKALLDRLAHPAQAFTYELQ
jgi:hypothetical protein